MNQKNSGKKIEKSERVDWGGTVTGQLVNCRLFIPHSLLNCWILWSLFCSSCVAIGPSLCNYGHRDGSKFTTEFSLLFPAIFHQSFSLRRCSLVNFSINAFNNFRIVFFFFQYIFHLECEKIPGKKSEILKIIEGVMLRPLVAALIRDVIPVTSSPLASDGRGENGPRKICVAPNRVIATSWLNFRHFRKMNFVEATMAQRLNHRWICYWIFWRQYGGIRSGWCAALTFHLGVHSLGLIYNMNNEWLMVFWWCWHFLGNCFCEWEG